MTLRLKKELLTDLLPGELRRVAGGGPSETCPESYTCPQTYKCIPEIERSAISCDCSIVC